jgi:LPS sulfotransferase NodH
MRQTQFVVLTTQRSGSSWLVDLLNAHPRIAAYAEMFRVTDTSVPVYGANRVLPFETMVPPGTWSVSRVQFRRRYDYLRGLGRAHPRAGAVGFKLMYDQTRDHPGLLATLVVRRTRFIHLVRHNHVRALLSFDVAERSNGWHPRAGEEVAATRVRVDPTRIVERLEDRASEIERFRRRLRLVPAAVLEVSFEELRADRDDVLARIHRFLRVPRSDLEPRTSIVPTPVRLADAIENVDDVRRALTGTRFASQLAELLR